MNKTTLILKEPRTGFFGNHKKEEKIDDDTFDIWKTELLKELPAFWESLSETKRK